MVIDSHEYSVEPESVLLGHEAWVVSLHWSPNLFGSLPKLASASADRSLIVWSYSPSTSLWLNEHRLGELGGPAGLGFFGALWGSRGTSVMAHDWNGSLHLWKRMPDDNAWEPGVGLTGHFKEVMDLEWESHGRWLLSARWDWFRMTDETPGSLVLFKPGQDDPSACTLDKAVHHWSIYYYLARTIKASNPRS